MKLLKLTLIALFTFFTTNFFGQTCNTDYSSYYENEKTFFYGYKSYNLKKQLLVFVTDVFQMCPGDDASYVYDLKDSLNDYIVANYVNDIKKADDNNTDYYTDKGFVTICYSFDMGNTIGQNKSDAKKNRNEVLSYFTGNTGNVKIIKIYAKDFDFNLPCH